MGRSISHVQMVPCSALGTRRLLTEHGGLLLVLGPLVPLVRRDLKQNCGLFHTVAPHPLNTRKLCGTLEIQEVIECDSPQ